MCFSKCSPMQLEDEEFFTTKISWFSFQPFRQARFDCHSTLGEEKKVRFNGDSAVPLWCLEDVDLMQLHILLPQPNGKRQTQTIEIVRLWPWSWAIRSYYCSNFWCIFQEQMFFQCFSRPKFHHSKQASCPNRFTKQMRSAPGHFCIGDPKQV